MNIGLSFSTNTDNFKNELQDQNNIKQIIVDTPFNTKNFSVEAKANVEKAIQEKDQASVVVDQLKFELQTAKEEQKQATFIQQLAAYIKEKLPNVKFDPRNPGLAFGEIRQRANKRIEPPAGLFSGKCRIVDGDGMSRFVFDPEICYNANNLDVFKALIDAAAGTGPQIATPAAAGVTPGKAATAPGQKPPVTSKSPTGIKPV